MIVLLTCYNGCHALAVQGFASTLAGFDGLNYRLLKMRRGFLMAYMWDNARIAPNADLFCATCPPVDLREAASPQIFPARQRTRWEAAGQNSVRLVFPAACPPVKP